ncbi:MAG: hypothetical protein JWM86_855 [Thermoleophilia bacterium]|nr:hypothetical protein [Thermoleophilia bacterium]
MSAYGAGDYERAAAIFTDDVQWNVFGRFESVGRDDYVRHMHDDRGIGHPDITVTRYFELDDAVIAEGTVSQELVGGGSLRLRFLDVFEFTGDHVHEHRSYVMAAPQQ